jgi:hypothetical protein
MSTAGSLRLAMLVIGLAPTAAQHLFPFCHCVALIPMLHERVRGPRPHARAERPVT